MCVWACPFMCLCVCMCMLVRTCVRSSSNGPQFDHRCMANQVHATRVQLTNNNATTAESHETCKRPWNGFWQQKRRRNQTKKFLVVDKYRQPSAVVCNRQAVRQTSNDHTFIQMETDTWTTTAPKHKHTLSLSNVNIRFTHTYVRTWTSVVSFLLVRTLSAKHTEPRVSIYLMICLPDENTVKSRLVHSCCQVIQRIPFNKSSNSISNKYITQQRSLKK